MCAQESQNVQSKVQFKLSVAAIPRMRVFKSSHPDFAVQQPDGLWVETVPDSAGVGVDAPVKSVRLGGRGPVEVLDDRQLRPGDMLGSSDLLHRSLFTEHSCHTRS